MEAVALIPEAIGALAAFVAVYFAWRAVEAARATIRLEQTVLAATEKQQLQQRYFDVLSHPPWIAGSTLDSVQSGPIRRSSDPS